MKAYEELKAEGKLWITGLDGDPLSEWYLDSGAKIERFSDGTFELKEVYTVGDRYRDMRPRFVSYFKEYGWYAGIGKLNVEYWSDKLESIEFRLRACFDGCERMTLQEQSREIAFKIERYKEMLNEALKRDTNSVS
jgi:hypothetical protein